MAEHEERRKAVRRKIEGLFASMPDDRRRTGYERRGRTSVLPMPLEMAVRGDQRRFEEAGTE
jgi:hypothetical protein